jgi:hypothetical protein
MAAQRKPKCLTCSRPAEIRQLCKACHQAVYRAGRLDDPTAVTEGLIGPKPLARGAWAKAALAVAAKKSSRKARVAR